MRPELEFAARTGDAEAVADLLDRGVDIDSLDKHGQTALMLAIVARHEAAASVLVRAGVDLALRGSGSTPGFQDKTAYDLAMERGMESLCREIQARAAAG